MIVFEEAKQLFSEARMNYKKHKPGSMPEQGLSGLTAAKVQHFFELAKFLNKKMIKNMHFLHKTIAK